MNGFPLSIYINLPILVFPYVKYMHISVCEICASFQLDFKKELKLYFYVSLFVFNLILSGLFFAGWVRVIGRIFADYQNLIFEKSWDIFNIPA